MVLMGNFVGETIHTPQLPAVTDEAVAPAAEAVTDIPDGASPAMPGWRPTTSPRQVDPGPINAGKETVADLPGASYLDSAASA